MVYLVMLFSLTLVLSKLAPSSNSLLASNLPETLATKLPNLDTYIASGNKAEGNNGHKEWFFVGHDQASRNGLQHSLLQFDLSDINSEESINSAMLSLKLELITPNDVPLTVNMYRVIGDWNNENISWQEFEANYQVDRSISATQIVGTEFVWYHWNVKPLLEAWLNDASHTSKFNVILESNQSSGQHQRGFWSKDCSDSRCERPKLEIQFATPTATPTPTNIPTATHTPTATPTPTIPVTLSLSHEVRRPAPTLVATAPTQIARVDILPGDELVYTIHYSVTTTVRNAQIKNKIPANVTLLDIKNGGIVTDSLITWDLDESSLTAGKTGAVSYDVVYEPLTSTIDISTLPLTPTVPVGQKLFFTIKMLDTLPDIKKYQWAFGDGETEEGRFPINTSHLYATSGRYTVTLTIETAVCYVYKTIDVTITDADTLPDTPLALSAQADLSHAIIANQLPTEPRLSKLPPCRKIESITNDGAIMTWGEPPGSLSSNILILNPVSVRHLPVVRTLK